MTLIEDHSTEAINEILSLLEGRVERCGQCQISSKTIRKTLKKRFGLSSSGARWVQLFVEGFLVGRQILTSANTTGPKQSRLVIYNIDPEQLRDHLLASRVFPN